MDDHVKAFELTDELLKMVTGGSFPSSIPTSTSTNVDTTVNVSHVTSNGLISVTQSHVTRQVNTAG